MVPSFSKVDKRPLLPELRRLKARLRTRVKMNTIVGKISCPIQRAMKPRVDSVSLSEMN